MGSLINSWYLFEPCKFLLGNHVTEEPHLYVSLFRLDYIISLRNYTFTSSEQNSTPVNEYTFKFHKHPISQYITFFFFFCSIWKFVVGLLWMHILIFGKQDIRSQIRWFKTLSCTRCPNRAQWPRVFIFVLNWFKIYALMVAITMI